jgi:hypothetical protein
MIYGLTYSEYYSRIACSATRIDVDTTVEISAVTPIAKDLIKVEFDSDLVVNNALLDPNSYNLSSVIEVATVLPIDGIVTSEVYLHLFPHAQPATEYLIIIPSAGAVVEIDTTQLPTETFYTPTGVPVATMSITWTQHRTKVDKALANLPKIYNKSIDSLLRMIVQTIMISDEKVGGKPISG